MPLRVGMGGAVVHRFDQAAIDRMPESGTDGTLHKNFEIFPKSVGFLWLVPNAGQHREHANPGRARVELLTVRQAGAQMFQKADFGQRPGDPRIPISGVDNTAPAKPFAAVRTIEFRSEDECRGRRDSADRRNIRVPTDP